jgi:uncharacterized protein YaiE (UPF0345 family)
MPREEQLLSSSIADTLRDARIAEKQYANAVSGARSVADLEDPTNYVLADAEGAMGFYLEKAYRDLSILAERLHLPQFARTLHNELRQFKRKGLTDLDIHPDDTEQHSLVLAKVFSYYESLTTMTNRRAVTGIDVFRKILENTPAILQLRQIVPKKEAEIQKAVFDVLGLAFNDVVREPSIGQILKTFKPDLGVRSLMAAAEFKFVTSRIELMSALEGIFADMKGYSGSDEWRTFFAVIYSTVAVTNISQLEEEFRGVRAEANWFPIIVFGLGGRKQPTQAIRRPR